MMDMQPDDIEPETDWAWADDDQQVEEVNHLIEEARDKQERCILARQVVAATAHWLEPLLVGGLSAGRTASIQTTAERLAETILIGLDNTVRSGGITQRFD